MSHGLTNALIHPHRCDDTHVLLSHIRMRARNFSLPVRRHIREFADLGIDADWLPAACQADAHCEGFGPCGFPEAEAPGLLAPPQAEMVTRPRTMTTPTPRYARLIG